MKLKVPTVLICLHFIFNERFCRGYVAWMHARVCSKWASGAAFECAFRTACQILWICVYMCDYLCTYIWVCLAWNYFLSHSSKECSNIRSLSIQSASPDWVNQFCLKAITAPVYVPLHCLICRVLEILFFFNHVTLLTNGIYQKHYYASG